MLQFTTLYNFWLPLGVKRATLNIQVFSQGKNYLQSLTLLLKINFKFPLQPCQKYCITQYEELGFSSLTQMKDDLYYHYSHYRT